MKDSNAITPAELSFADRGFPLETVTGFGFRLRHGMDAGDVTLHTGPFADELTRSFGALAVTFAADVYFRKGYWNPASEEGEKLLAHELAHAAQYTEKRIDPSSPKEELEAEARRAEDNSASDEDPIVSLRANGETFYLRRSWLPAAAGRIAAEIGIWLREQENALEAQEYLGLVCSFEKWLSDI